MLHWLVEERNDARHVDYSVGLGIVLGTLVSQEQRICPTRLTTMQKVAICGLFTGCVWHIDQVSPIGCTSIRIAATLEYE
jgi:hypothetical protein